MKKLLSSFVIAIIVVYQRVIPYFRTRSVCIFYPSCSEYAVLAFKKYPFFKALKKTLHRLSRCHPGNEPGEDYP